MEDEERQAPRMRDAEMDALVAEVVRYMLFKNFQQPGVPIKREELAQIVTSSHKQHRGLSAVVIEKARKRIATVFGIEMRELLKARHSNRGGDAPSKADSQREYLLRSTVPVDLRREFVDEEEGAALWGLALAIVSIIKLSPAGRCGQESLWRHLNKLGIEEQQEQHPAFGSIKQAMDQLQRQRFFRKERDDADGWVYTLAERGLDEEAARRIVGWMSKFVDVTERDDDSDKESDGDDGDGDGDGDGGEQVRSTGSASE